MNAFLTQLAGMALGHGPPGAAYVVLPPRFAPPHIAADIPQSVWLPHDNVAAAADQVPSPPRYPLQSDRRETEHDDDAPAVFSKPAPIVRREMVTPPLPRPSPDIPQQHLSAAAPARSDMPRSSRRNAAAAPASFTLSTAPPVAPMPRRDTPPLSDAALATRVGKPEPAPVVHVTIDRIDVRAPDVVKPAAPSKPPRRQPTVSLADYLRNSRSGSRA
jgi:hypothetical protein